MNSYIKTGTDPQGRGICLSSATGDEMRIINGKIYRKSPRTGDYTLIVDEDPMIFDNTVVLLKPHRSYKAEFLEWAEGKRNISGTDPFNRGLKVGQKVVFVNGYGLRIGPHEILGFRTDSESEDDRNVYIDIDAYWAGVRASMLEPFNENG